MAGSFKGSTVSVARSRNYFMVYLRSGDNFVDKVASIESAERTLSLKVSFEFLISLL